ncbi:MAG: hypothetical protein MUD01_21420 [Chloroflexaceae bacterium]|jgi:ubiquitin-associated SH3 domain-containing protein|nr:hypothetical protein [Chloroflexaceae bacterium]
MTLELILYACPSGSLAAQIEEYYRQSREACGPNQAHRYPPHITLTGFFHDEAEAVPGYLAALEAALQRARAAALPTITIKEMALGEAWHGLEIDSPWLQALAADFAAHAASPSRRDAIRLKDWLHVSLAYGFAPEQGPALAALASELVDVSAAVVWELRFYERLPGDEWRCHGVWELA